jgi:hypothetical protein
VYSDFYEIPLPALRFEKVEETDTKVNDTEENDAFQIDHVRERKKTSEMTDDAQQRKADSLTRNDTQRNSNASKMNANMLLQTTLTRSRTEDLKIRKSRHLFIREIKLKHSKNVHH